MACEQCEAYTLEIEDLQIEIEELQEAQDAGVTFAEELEADLETEKAEKEKHETNVFRERHKSDKLKETIEATEAEVKKKLRKIAEVEKSLEEARKKGDEGKNDVIRLEREKDKIEMEVRMMESKLDDKTEAMELMEEQQVFYEEEVDNYTRMLEQAQDEMKELQVKESMQKEKINKLEAEIARKEGMVYKPPEVAEVKLSGLDAACAKLEKAKMVREQMKEFVESAKCTGEETPEERAKRKSNLRAIKRLMTMKNGYSAKDSLSTRSWIRLKKHMKEVQNIMEEEQGMALFSLVRKKSVYATLTLPLARWTKIKDNLSILLKRMAISGEEEDA